MSTSTERGPGPRALDWIVRQFSGPRGLAQILVLALLVREVFAGWTGDPYDFEDWIRTGYVVGHGIDPYPSNWPAVPGYSIAYFGQTLPPASYLPFWALYAGGSYQLALHAAGGNRFVYYFLLKQAPIAGDVLTAYLLARLVRRWDGTTAQSLRVAAAWALFPYTIVVSAIWGQFDSIVVAVVLGSLLVAGAVGRNLLYGLGIFVKWFSAMFVPYELFRTRGWARLAVVLAVVVPAGLTLAVLAALGWGFGGIGSSASIASGGIGGGMNWARWVSPFGPFALVGAWPGASIVLPTLWIAGVVAVGYWVATRSPPGTPPARELNALLAIVTAFVLLRWGLNEQYMLYLFAPLLLDVLLFHAERRALGVTLGVLAFAYLIMNHTLFVAYAAPLGPQYQAWANGANHAYGWHQVRLWGLDGLAILITVSLAQLLTVTLGRPGGGRPWILGGGWWTRRRARPGSGPGASPSGAPAP